MSSFARQVAGGQTVLRVGDLSAKRDFIDVAEAARLLVALAVLPNWQWPLINTCSGRAYRLGARLNSLIEASGTKIRIETDPALMQRNEMRMLIGRITRWRK